jgi:hypothetical protein
VAPVVSKLDLNYACADLFEPAQRLVLEAVDAAPRAPGGVRLAGREKRIERT